MPEIEDIGEFFLQFQRWWSSFQPSWHTSLHTQPFDKSSPPHSDWSKLGCTSPNGITLIVLSLTWLSAYIRSDHVSSSKFFTYIDDATWAFNQIVGWMESGRYIEPPLKHKADIDSDGIKLKLKLRKM